MAAFEETSPDLPPRDVVFPSSPPLAAETSEAEVLSTPPASKAANPTSDGFAPPPPSRSQLRAAEVTEPRHGIDEQHRDDQHSDEQHRAQHHGGRRPWWGMGDIPLGVVFILVFAGIGLGVALLGATGDLGTLVISGLFQQGAMFGWPIIVTAWKGTTARRDWRLYFRWVDPLIGIGVGVGGLIAATIVGLIVSQLVGLSDPEAASNTGLLQDAESSPWLAGMVFMTVVGAPLSEELFFRGLCLRSIQNRFGPTIAVIGSTVLFMSVHLPYELGDDWVLGLAVLWSSIATIGALLAVVTMTFDRLGPAIFAHATFNLISVILTLLNPFDLESAWLPEGSAAFLGWL